MKPFDRMGYIPKALSGFVMMALGITLGLTNDNVLGPALGTGGIYILVTIIASILGFAGVFILFRYSLPFFVKDTITRANNVKNALTEGTNSTDADGLPKLRLTEWNSFSRKHKRHILIRGSLIFLSLSSLIDLTIFAVKYYLGFYSSTSVIKFGIAMFWVILFYMFKRNLLSWLVGEPPSERGNLNEP